VKGPGTVGIHFGQGIAHLQHDAGPQVGVHPDMRVVAVRIIVMRNQKVARQVVRNRDHGAGFAEFDQEFLHLRLEVETVPQDQIGIRRCDDIAARLAVGMRIDAGPHECETSTRSPPTSRAASAIMPVVATTSRRS
jgi:hypothetical protein